MIDKTSVTYQRYIKYKETILDDFTINTEGKVMDDMLALNTYSEIDAYCQKLIDNKLGYKERKGNWNDN